MNKKDSHSGEIKLSTTTKNTAMKAQMPHIQRVGYLIGYTT